MKPTYDELLKMVLSATDDLVLFEWGLLETPKTIPDIVLECDHSEPCWKPCVCEQDPCEHCFMLLGGCDCIVGWIEERE